MSTQYMNIQLTEMLELDRNQIEKIHSINLTYQTKAAGLLGMPGGSHVEKKVNRLLHQRNKEIIDVLTDDQQKILYTYCTDLISFSGRSNESKLTLW